MREACPGRSLGGYSTFLGGTTSDTGNGVAVDGEGRAYVTGSSSSPDFPSSPGAFDRSYNGAGDVFVASVGPVQGGGE